jgi:hypothetical protein
MLWVLELTFQPFMLLSIPLMEVTKRISLFMIYGDFARNSLS